MKPITVIATIFLVAITRATRLNQRQLSVLGSAPSVTIKNGTVVGKSQNGIDSFLGVPFALPPVGDLRLRQPQTYNKNLGTLQATSFAPSCIEVSGKQALSSLQVGQLEGSLSPSELEMLQSSPLLKASLSQQSKRQASITSDGTDSEDCLYLNVQRPSTAKAGSKLPVVIWIYGGGFETGATNQFDATDIMTRSISLDAPFIYVDMGYRLSGYGFLPGKEVQQEDASNLGLHDQRKAMQWVQENIASFGGDPDHVVIWGESAGSISVFDHTIINDGDKTYNGKALFHGAVMNSGSVLPTRDVNSTKAQAVYDSVVDFAGCSNSPDTSACLRSLPTSNYTAALSETPGLMSYQSVSLDFLPRPDPSTAFFSQSPELSLSQGKFASVPLINGDQQDEGTFFALYQDNITTTDQLIDYFSNVFFPGTPRQAIAQLVDAYPDDPAAGSPYNTGILYNIYPQYKRLASILGDIAFTLRRREQLSYVSQQNSTWSYINSYLQVLPVLGTFHSADVYVLYDALPTTLQNPQLPIDYYISFSNSYDPNALASNAPTSNASVYWPSWKNETRQLLNFALLDTHEELDDFRETEYNTILELGSYLRI